MSVQHYTYLYDVHDAKVYSCTSNTASASPTYGAAVDVPTVSQLSLTPQFTSGVLKGDGRIRARKGRLDSLQCSVQHGDLSLDVLAVIFGGSVTDTSATQADYGIVAPTALPNFMLQARMQDTDSGSGVVEVHLKLHVCMVTGGTLLGQASDQFGQPSFQLDCYPPANASTKLFDLSLYSSATPLDA